MDIRLLFDPMALSITSRAIASGLSTFAAPGVCPGPVAIRRFAPHRGVSVPLTHPLPPQLYAKKGWAKSKTWIGPATCESRCINNTCCAIASAFPTELLI